MVPAILDVMETSFNMGCLKRLVRQRAGEWVWSQQSPIRAAVPCVFVGMTQAKNPGARSCPRRMWTYRGSREMLVTSAPMPRRISLGCGNPKEDRIVEWGPSAPMRILLLSCWLFSFCWMFTVTSVDSFCIAVALDDKKNSAPALHAALASSWSKRDLSMTSAWILSSPMVRVYPAGEWMCAP